MEDDDEFGDLYTDVLRPFASSSSLSSASQPHQPSPAPPSLHSPIDLNLKSSNDDDGIVFGAPHSSSTAPNQTLAPQPKEPVREAVKLDLAPNSIAREDSAGVARVLEAGYVELPRRTGPEAGVVESEALSRGGGEGGVDLMDKDVNFDIEEGNTGIDDIGSEPIIPGLSGGGGSGSGGDAMVRGLTVNLEASRKDDASGGGGGSGENDWDSDSDDDLQIVLNDDLGHVRRLAKENIRFTVEGEGELIGNASINANPRAVEWGSAPVLIRSTRQAGKIKIKAEVQFPGTHAPTPAELEIESVPSTMPACYLESEKTGKPGLSGKAGNSGQSAPTLTDAEKAKLLQEVEAQQADLGIQK